jgi:hypothetical protein
MYMSGVKLEYMHNIFAILPLRYIVRGCDGILLWRDTGLCLPLHVGRCFLPLHVGRCFLPLHVGRCFLPLHVCRCILPLHVSRCFLPLHVGRCFLPLTSTVCLVRVVCIEWCVWCALSGACCVCDVVCAKGIVGVFGYLVMIFVVRSAHRAYDFYGENTVEHALCLLRAVVGAWQKKIEG